MAILVFLPLTHHYYQERERFMKTFPRPGSYPERDAIAQKYGLDVVYRMSHNESPLGPSPKVIEAITEAAQDLGHYPTMGDEILRQTLAETFGRGLTPDHFYSGCSGYETIELVARAYLEAGDEVIVSPPTFGAYYKVIAAEGAKAVDVPLLKPSYTPDIDGILNAVTDKTRFVMICNPNNPTGHIMPAEQMDRLVRELPDHVMIIADEVYYHFVTDEQFPDSIQYVVDNKNVIVIHTFSKAYGLPGLRMGYGVAKPEIANRVGGLHRGFHQNKLNLAAGVAALKDQEHLKRNVQAVIDGREWIQNQLDRLDLAYWPATANYLVVDLNRPAQEVIQLLQSKGVLVRPMAGEGLENHIRVTTTVSEGNALFIESLREILA